MQITLSRQMLESITKLVSHVHSKCEMLDVFQAATAIQQLHYLDNVALEDIVNEIVLRATPGTAMMLAPTEVAVKFSGNARNAETPAERDKEQALTYPRFAALR